MSDDDIPDGVPDDLVEVPLRRPMSDEERERRLAELNERDVCPGCGDEFLEAGLLPDDELVIVHERSGLYADGCRVLTDGGDGVRVHSGEENLYLKAIHHPERDEQLLAMHQFLADELDDQFGRLADLEGDEGNIPEETGGQWNYEKGKLDALRMWQGLVTQACLAQDVFETPDETPGNTDRGPQP